MAGLVKGGARRAVRAVPDDRQWLPFHLLLVPRMTPLVSPALLAEGCRCDSRRMAAPAATARRAARAAIEGDDQNQQVLIIAR